MDVRADVYVLAVWSLPLLLNFVVVVLDWLFRCRRHSSPQFLPVESPPGFSARPPRIVIGNQPRPESALPGLLQPLVDRRHRNMPIHRFKSIYIILIDSKIIDMCLAMRDHFSFYVEGQFGLISSEGALDVLGHPFTIVASSWMDLDSSLALDLNSCLVHPFSVQFFEVFASSVRGVISIGVFQGRELILPQSLEKPDFVSLLKNVKIEQLEFDSVILLRRDGFVLLPVPKFDLLLSKMIPT